MVPPAVPWLIEHHETVDSTNRLAADRIHGAWRNNQSPARIVITADGQTAGRGQHGRAWISPPGGLYLSAIIEGFPPTGRTSLPLLAGVAVVRAIEELGPPFTTLCPPELRWPNDILIGGKKVAGVLCESFSQGPLWAAVIGVGINVHIPLETLTYPLFDKATSLHLHQPQLQTLDPLLRSLLSSLDQCLIVVQSSGPAPILALARRLDFLVHKQIEFQADDCLHTGTAAGISDSGELVVNIGGRLRSFGAGTLVSVNTLPVRAD